MGLTVHFEVLNQLGTPMMYSDTLANRPAAGISGRIFFRTDTPFGIYRDNGTSWDQISSVGGGGISGSGTATQVAFWSGSSSISSSANLYWDNTNQRLGIGTATPGVPLDIHSTGTNAQFNGTTTNNAFVVFQNAGASKWRLGNNYSAGTNYFSIYDSVNAVDRLKIDNTGALSTTTTITTSAGSTGFQGIYNSNTVTIPASTTFGSGGYTYVGYNQFYAQNFAGSATYQNNNINSSIFGLNRIDFTAAGGTVTMTQATGVRAMSAAAFQNQYAGTNSGTITHLAGAEILGFYRSAGAGVLSVTNAYGLIINNIDDYAAGFTYTNRWATFQQGSSDNNYFAGKVLIGTTTISTYGLDLVGSNARINGIPIGIGTSSSTTNTIIGLDSSLGTITGTSNVHLGYRAGRFVTSGSDNTYIGVATAPNDNTGTRNVVVGSNSGNVINGNYNAVLGAFTGAGINAGNFNTIIGCLCGGQINNVNNNIVIGTYSGTYLTTWSNTLIINSLDRSTSANEETNSIIYGKQSTTLSNQILRLNARTGVGLSADPVASAQLQIDSTTSGFLPPRMTTTQKNAITSPATGLVIFDTTLAKLCVYTGSAWQTVTSV